MSNLENSKEIKSKNLFSYLIILFGQFLSLIGTQVLQFSITWWITLELRSGFALGLMVLLNFGTIALLTPFTGVFADRYNRKFLIVLSDTFQIIPTIILILLFSSNLIQYWHLFVWAVIVGIFQSIQLPAISSITVLMVPEEKVSRVVSLQALMNNIGFLIAPPIAVTLLVHFKIYQIFWLDVITYIFAIFALLIITIPPTPKTPTRDDETTEKKPTFFAQFKEGFVYIFQDKLIFRLLLVIALGNFIIAPLVILLPLLVVEVYNGDNFFYATLVMSYYASMIIMLAVMTIWKGFKKKIHGIFFGYSLGALGILLIGLTPNVDIAIVVLSLAVFIGSIATSLVGVTGRTLWVKIIPPEKQGRVFSFLSIFYELSPLTSVIIASILADIIGVSLVYTLYGGLGVIILLLVWFLTNFQEIEQGLTKSSETELSLNEFSSEETITAK